MRLVVTLLPANSSCAAPGSSSGEVPSSLAVSALLTTPSEYYRVDHARSEPGWLKAVTNSTPLIYVRACTWVETFLGGQRTLFERKSALCSVYPLEGLGK